ncbi:hypothetical protein CBOM_01798 [Ceraceosorus bombacis]|uniref:Uncharacterized protein n=1 Tax=Ceraceosorus bombacis TaxID=401625 RepID=A0A0P1BDQ5_9BASI|nr:hypothetical protein CBOM_01798 [Ceraceosorus bombacis]
MSSCGYKASMYGMHLNVESELHIERLSLRFDSTRLALPRGDAECELALR